MAFAKFGTPFPSVVFCPIRLLIGLWGEERETDLLELHIQLIMPSQKESSILTIQGRQIIQLLLGLRRQTLVFQKLSLNNLALNVSTGKQESNAHLRANKSDTTTSKQQLKPLLCQLSPSPCP